MGNVVRLPLVSSRVERKLFPVRPVSQSVKRMPKARLSEGAREADAILAELGPQARPKTRGDCVGGERPCPWVSCRHHLALDVSAKTGSIKENFPGAELAEMPETCALDVADAGPATLDRIGEVMNVVRERVRQIEEDAIGKLQRAHLEQLRKDWDDDRFTLPEPASRRDAHSARS